MDLEAESIVSVDTGMSKDIADSCNKLLETQKKILLGATFLLIFSVILPSYAEIESPKKQMQRVLSDSAL